MAVGYNPRIVTDGLVLALDAGNTQSYVGSGTTWRDLSGRGNTGTLTNGPTYSNSNGGIIVLDGVDDYVNIAASSSMTMPGDFTIELWTRQTSITSFNTLFEMGTYANGVMIRPGDSTVFINGSSINHGLTLNQWTHIVVTRIGTTCTVYNNTTSTGSATISGTVNSSPGATWIGNSTHAPSRYFAGYVSNVRVLNGKGLTTSEISQNFNALRGRFGI